MPFAHNGSKILLLAVDGPAKADKLLNRLEQPDSPREKRLSIQSAIDVATRIAIPGLDKHSLSPVASAQNEISSKEQEK